MVQVSADETISMLYSLGRKLKREFGGSGGLFNLTMPQLEAVKFIGDQKVVSMREFANFLSVSPPSATSFADNLLSLGFVERQRDEQSRRTVNLKLTKKGSVALNRAVAERCRHMKILLGCLSGEEQLMLLDLIKKMVNGSESRAVTQKR